ncbi:Na+/H+ antiporter NhaA [Microbacterium dextranolyticum]|uniref:Na(+)/H(+) antiporter NhaA n=1 Tax=Microbacterium dextranolyticum TaxID=36806 RepID=A0A9W6M661_9MICO|nr:Na+/H+ antiporter NhaA [Microbacterium dextranolyticum]MBM7463375.1 NhaA family Na+:H+ antiporter [Microbacterium dextranolyticum]GLJ95522.1 Na(+)/H(+) antiporter NhaA [Microbacterium dextranolyticum]
MPLTRSPRFPAVLLLLAAATGLLLANSPMRDSVFEIADARVGVPGLIELSGRHVVSDGLLALFFFAAAVELRHELTRGRLASVRRALLPAVAAAGGVVVPVLVYLVIAGGSDTARGWPIPTATDVAFALGVLAVFGPGLPAGVRVFLLALAILDDVVGIVLIAVLFTAHLEVVPLGIAAILVVVFGWLSVRHVSMRASESVTVRVAWRVVLIALAVAVWGAVHASGVHATIAGVALGLAMTPRGAARARHALEPWVAVVVLPLFALTAALVPLPAASVTELSPAFWGVVVALPLGKLLGIAVATALGSVVLRVPHPERLAFGDLLAVAALGGIGFTVSLLLGDLAFAGQPDTRDQATLGVLAGSSIALVVAAMLVSWRSWHHRRARPVPATIPDIP